MTTALEWLGGIGGGFVALGAYLGYGRRVAKAQLPQIWAKSKRDWKQPENQQMRALMTYRRWKWLWPVMVVHRGFEGSSHQIVAAADPDRLQRHIDDLERRLGIESGTGIGTGSDGVQVGAPNSDSADV